MNIVLAAEQLLYVGRATLIEGAAPNGEFAAVFEDDGDTGYFYATHGAASEHRIHAAAHIYNVQSISGSGRYVSVKVGWSSDSAKVMLIIDDIPQAVFDFRARQGFCRTGFPCSPSHGDWTMNPHPWSDSVMGLFA
jgi:hypothetical protein